MDKSGVYHHKKPKTWTEVDLGLAADAHQYKAPRVSMSQWEITGFYFSMGNHGVLFLNGKSWGSISQWEITVLNISMGNHVFVHLNGKSQVIRKSWVSFSQLWISIFQWEITLRMKN
jgi:hypothetical protein